MLGNRKVISELGRFRFSNNKFFVIHINSLPAYGQYSVWINQCSCVCYSFYYLIIQVEHFLGIERKYELGGGSLPCKRNLEIDWLVLAMYFLLKLDWLQETGAKFYIINLKVVLNLVSKLYMGCIVRSMTFLVSL
ncbi:unnamed protein product [Cuscuta epithymum]|uniref:Uncharacterized protein n=1 Tax=Cuscuta epithymum TaxID=186058 RepID=A0AAV0C5V6_9ASTE|nr:unnamed protein product [Cuscuta epithymum]